MKTIKHDDLFNVGDEWGKMGEIQSKIDNNRLRSAMNFSDNATTGKKYRGQYRNLFDVGLQATNKGKYGKNVSKEHWGRVSGTAIPSFQSFDPLNAKRENTISSISVSKLLDSNNAFRGLDINSKMIKGLQGAIGKGEKKVFPNGISMNSSLQKALDNQLFLKQVKNNYSFITKIDKQSSTLNKMSNKLSWMDSAGVNQLIKANRSVMDEYFGEMTRGNHSAFNQAARIMNWTAESDAYLNFLEKNNLILADSLVTKVGKKAFQDNKVTKSNILSALSLSKEEYMSEPYEPTAIEQEQAVVAVQNNNVKSLPEKLALWVVNMIAQGLMTKLIMIIFMATPTGTEATYFEQHELPNAVYTLTEQHPGHDLGTSCFMKAVRRTPVWITRDKSDGRVLEVLSKGDTLRACEYSGKWLRVEWDHGQYGWVLASYMQHINLKK